MAELHSLNWVVRLTAEPVKLVGLITWTQQVFVRSLVNHVITLVGLKMVILETEASLFCIHISAELGVRGQKLLLWRVHPTNTQAHAILLFSYCSLGREGEGGWRWLCCPSPFPHAVQRLKRAPTIKGCSFLAKLSHFLVAAPLLFIWLRSTACLHWQTEWDERKQMNKTNIYLFIYLLSAHKLWQEMTWHTFFCWTWLKVSMSWIISMQSSWKQNNKTNLGI